MGVLLCRSDYAFEYSTNWKNPVDTEDFIEKLDNFTRLEWFQSQHANWHHQDVEFQKVLALRGHCYNVKMNENVYRRDT